MSNKGRLTMRLLTAAALFPVCVLFAAGTGIEERSPVLTSSTSPWNVRAYGGKGEMQGAPICRPLDFFSKSPLPLDFDADFFGEKEADLVTRAQVGLLGTIDAQKIYEVKLTVVRKQPRSGVPKPDAPPTMKVLLIERGNNEFCDIYQNQYAYDPTRETDEAAILDLSGKKVLKTFETDKRTWYLEYWTIANHKPLRLKADDIYKAISSASPPDALPFSGPLNLTGSHLAVDMFANSPDRGLRGKVDIQLSVEGDKIVALTKTWTPSVAAGVE